jgi:hypothetical protein
MKRVVVLCLTTLGMAGCTGRSPVQPELTQAPPPAPPPPATALWAKVVESGGVCIQDAKVVGVGGPVDGQLVTQNLPCDAWDEGGITLQGLTIGAEQTLRASAAGYASREFKLTPTPTSYQTAYLMVLTEP